MSLPKSLSHYLNLSQGVWEITSSHLEKQIITTVSLITPQEFETKKDIISKFTQEYELTPRDIDMVVVLNADPGKTTYLAYSSNYLGKVFIISGYEGYTSALGYEVYEEGEYINYKSYRLHEPDFYEQITLHVSGDVRTKHYFFSGIERTDLQRIEKKTITD